jgi:hypothetical protein
MSGAVPLPVCTGTNLEAKFLIRCLLGIRVFQYVTPCRCASSCLSVHNPAAQGRGKTGILSSAAGESLRVSNHCALPVSGSVAERR